MLTNEDVDPANFISTLSFNYCAPWLYEISATSLKLYLVLGSLTKPGEPQVTIPRKALARMMGYKSARHLDRYIAELEGNRIITVVHNRRPDGGLDANTYELGDVAP